MSVDTATPSDLSGLRRLGEPLPFRAYVREIWERRDFLFAVPLSDLRAQNQNTMLGGLWHLLNPLLLTGVFYVVFGVILGGRGGIDNYPAFLVVGVLTFTFIQKLAMTGTRTVVANIKLIQSLSFPRAILPLAATTSETLAQIPALLAMMVLTLLTGEALGVTWLLVVPILALQATLGAGVALITARLTFHFRDTQQLLPYVLRMLLYLSGVFFGADKVPAGWPRTLFELNPAYAFIKLNRLALIENTTALAPWLIAGAWSAVLLVGGFLFFRAHEHEYGNG